MQLSVQEEEDVKLLNQLLELMPADDIRAMIAEQKTANAIKDEYPVQRFTIIDNMVMTIQTQAVEISTMKAEIDSLKTDIRTLIGQIKMSMNAELVDFTAICSRENIW